MTTRAHTAQFNHIAADMQSLRNKTMIREPLASIS
jgi:hypothetical protein